MSTLRLGSNSRDVITLKQYLNYCLNLRPPLPTTTHFDRRTDGAVRSFQQSARLRPVDGVVGGGTWGALVQHARARAAPTQSAAVTQMSANVQPGPLAIRPEVFVPAYVRRYGRLDASAQSGLTALLRFISQDREIRDVRWAAYMLATTMHECGRTWQPIREWGRGAGREYGKAVLVNGVRHTYYGRGYVQLTWKRNYAAVGEAIGLGQQLLNNPERALEPQVAYRVMSYGMRHGTFTSKSLSDYIAGAACDYVRARRIINGLDKAETIAGYSRALEAMLRSSIQAPAS